MKTRALLPIAVAAVALAGCSSEDPADTTAAPAGAATSSAAPAAGTSSAAAPSSAAATGGGCPVDATALQKAFQANAEVAGAIILGKGFKDISCYQGYATALTQPEAMDTAVVVFKYDPAKKTWAALIGGTDNVCENTVPAAIRPNLKHCT
ncbi:hypothetical protein ACFO1B_42230 [Dactylosporangium siamense]|uniref:Lipoprotein n=1 Tax=Dactylosporangium siamense TaxID=685454 RepID=A0A919UG93_9ACTN|nr:hypothetical protein [Dactylosporangium siamense]GIG51041.1 hypothetical protein Dsi01nite_090820 [Dactylosporangium siamense]